MESYNLALTEFLKEPHEKQITWLSKNNRIIQDDEYWLVIANSYRVCVTAFVKRNNVWHFSELEREELESMIDIIKFFPDRSMYYNREENRSIKDRFHFHLTKKDIQQI